MRNWQKAVILVIALVLVIGFGVASHRGPDATAVDAITVKPTSLVVRLPENGVVSVPQTATIAAQSAGEIVAIDVHEGQRVGRGDLLMKLDDRQIAATLVGDQAAVAQAQSLLAAAQAKLQADINSKR